MYPQRLKALIRQPISFLERSGLGTRAQNALERAGYRYVGDVLSATFDTLCLISGYDIATHRQVLESLRQEGVRRIFKLSQFQTIKVREVTPVDIFENDKFRDCANQIMDAIQSVEGSVKLGMTVEGNVHPQSLVNLLMGIKEQQIHASQQVAVLSSMVKAMSSRLPEDELDSIVEEFATDIAAKVTQLEEVKQKRTKEDNKPKIVMPQTGKVIK